MSDRTHALFVALRAIHTDIELKLAEIGQAVARLHDTGFHTTLHLDDTETEETEYSDEYSDESSSSDSVESCPARITLDLDHSLKAFWAEHRLSEAIG